MYNKSYYFTDLARNRSTNCKVQDKGVSVHVLMAYGGLCKLVPRLVTCKVISILKGSSEITSSQYRTVS